MVLIGDEVAAPGQPSKLVKHESAHGVVVAEELVAGPIVRAADFLPQCLERRELKSGFFGWGATLMTIGIFQKVALADALLAPVADRVYNSTVQSTFMDAWIGTLAFSAQIFFDFAGYSTVAIGAALMLGFVLPDNFRSPYAARGFSDFWRRWHISLSSWTSSLLLRFRRLRRTR